MTENQVVSALTIAGSDSGGGAGIQADLKTFAAHRVDGLAASAALTAQHTRGVTAVNVPPMDFLRAQLDACFDDFDVGAVKLGMLANAEVIHAVADALEAHRPRFVVLDPVMVATSGAKLLEDAALDALRTRLIPLADILTPNVPEAELLTGMRIVDGEAAELALGPVAVPVVVGIARDEAVAADAVDGLHALNHMHRERQLGNPGAAGLLVGQVDAGGRRVVQRRICPQVIGRANQQMWLAATLQVHIAQGTPGLADLFVATMKGTYA